MIRAYSQRLLPPYSGVVQIVDADSARAQSFDGVNWEIHYLSGADRARGGRNRDPGFALDRGYYNVASLRNGVLKTFILPAFLDPAEVGECIAELVEFLASAKVPFPAADLFEFWLLDGADQSPLALMFACCAESQMANFPPHTEWTAMPHSKMKIANTEGEDARGEPPVNHRFQRAVARRAGGRPRGAWFRRESGDAQSFPELLFREDWSDPADHDLCQRYLTRKAPRLLMLHGLSSEGRDRLEEAAKAYVFEVDDYFPLYPAVVDPTRMTAIRVEARLRRNAPMDTTPTRKPEREGSAPLSKDQRIFET